MEALLSRRSSQAGIGLTETLIATAIMGMFVLVVMQMQDLVSLNQSLLARQSVLLEVNSRVSGIMNASGAWVNQLKTSALSKTQFASCFKTSGASCPDAAPANSPEMKDPTLSDIRGSRAIASVPLVDSKGIALSGATANPVAIDRLAQPLPGACDENPACVAKVTSYLIFEDDLPQRPGNVDVVVKVEWRRREGYADGAPRYWRIPLGRLWKPAVTTCVVSSKQCSNVKNFKIEWYVTWLKYGKTLDPNCCIEPGTYVGSIPSCTYYPNGGDVEPMEDCRRHGYPAGSWSGDGCNGYACFMGFNNVLMYKGKDTSYWYYQRPNEWDYSGNGPWIMCGRSWPSARLEAICD